MFDTVLVANRGEIACRVIETLRRLGILSVAVYSDADRGAKHVAMADVAVHIGPAAPESSYLNIDAIVDAARRTGAQAIHPGYGFLSENAQFALACEAAGIVFVGPGVKALEVMGDKIRSKNHVAPRGVPVTPGIAEPGLTDEQLVAAASDIGFPLLIKPSAGGGGKGMTAVHDAAELPDALVAARRVAASAFGDDTLFLERLVSEPRHIEVQVLADAHGTVVHLGERECSLQRRHQKIVEEAPSALLDAETRARIGEAACEVARSVDYLGAGTVEFLVSANAPGEFFFMEMNTRLQVEHPVTELVATIRGDRGIDLVEQQLRIAAREPLGFEQADVALSGHAIEARVYAEVPSRGFLPATGTVLALEEPGGEGIRVDSSLLEGLEISPTYDPMLAKVIAWGSGRAQALDRLDRALAETVVLGVSTNVEFLRALLASDDVLAGRLDTGLIERLLPTIEFHAPDDVEFAAAAMAVHFDVLPAQAPFPGRGPFPAQAPYPGRGPFPEGATFPELVEGTGRATRSLREPQGAVGPQRAVLAQAASSPWHSRSGWRIGEHRPARYSFARPDGPIDIRISGTPDAATITIADRPPTPATMFAFPEKPASSHTGAPDSPGESRKLRKRGHGGEVQRTSVEIGGEVRTVRMARAGASVWIASNGTTTELVLRDRATQVRESRAAMLRTEGAADPAVRAPMPGTVVAVNAAAGDSVEPGQTLLTIEAMKMEHKLLATLAGIVHLSVTPGDLVRLDEVVATITPHEGK